MRWNPWRRKAQPEAAPPSEQAIADASVADAAITEAPITEAAMVAVPAAAPTVPDLPEQIEEPESPQSRFARLRTRIQATLAMDVTEIFQRGTLDDETWDRLEETLLVADVGAAATSDILDAMRARLRRDSGADPLAVLRDELLAIVDPSLDRGLALGGGMSPMIVVGVNGVGKTTTVGKLARVLVAQDQRVILAAADTFRAAAADQLQAWGTRVGVPVVRSDREGADPAAVAFEAMQRGVDDGADVVLIDTAGRLQNKQGLMDELGKVVRVASKVASPREVLLVLDATTGQNGLTQARVFKEAVGLTGIVLTKLDGSAKGGIVLAVQRELGVPVKFVGLGEGADDLAPFDAAGFVDGLLGR